MALSKDKKNSVVAEVAELLAESKMTVVAQYTGTTVKAMQTLRRDARANGTKVKVVKNRLAIQAVKQVDKLKDVDTSALNGMLVYAFNAEDEVAPAQALATFARLNPTIQFVGAITADGNFIGADDVKALASLPSKEQLRGQLVGTIAAPLTGFVGVMSANLRSVLYALNARAEQL